ncbi:MAG TPA: hypothetical protein VMK31_06915 [Sphingomicrobium sp.]|nr:hypothetical protein [Sphingomicrobium sp.]
MDTVQPPEIPDFKSLAADPEIAPLLAFEPVVRKVKRPNGWTPELQRELIARLAATGTLQQAVWQMGKHATGAEGLYKVPSATSFRQSWDAAVIIGRRRNHLDSAPPFAGPVPGITRRGKSAAPPPDLGDSIALARQADEARDSISEKLLGCRRLYLQEISASPGKRAAFEILTRLPIDWDKAERLEPQDDEPWRRPNMRKPDMLLTAENGWLGDMAHGEDKMAELRAAVDAHRAEQGLEPVEWGESAENKTKGGET